MSKAVTNVVDALSAHVHAVLREESDPLSVSPKKLRSKLEVRLGGDLSHCKKAIKEAAVDFITNMARACHSDGDEDEDRCVGSSEPPGTQSQPPHCVRNPTPSDTSAEWREAEAAWEKFGCGYALCKWSAMGRFLNDPSVIRRTYACYAMCCAARYGDDALEDLTCPDFKFFNSTLFDLLRNVQSEPAHVRTFARPWVLNALAQLAAKMGDRTIANPPAPIVSIYGAPDEFDDPADWAEDGFYGDNGETPHGVPYISAEECALRLIWLLDSSALTTQELGFAATALDVAFQHIHDTTYFGTAYAGGAAHKLSVWRRCASWPNPKWLPDMAALLTLPSASFERDYSFDLPKHVMRLLRTFRNVDPSPRLCLIEPLAELQSMLGLAIEVIESLGDFIEDHTTEEDRQSLSNLAWNDLYRRGDVKLLPNLSRWSGRRPFAQIMLNQAISAAPMHAAAWTSSLLPLWPHTVNGGITGDDETRAAAIRMAVNKGRAPFLPLSESPPLSSFYESLSERLLSNVPDLSDIFAILSAMPRDRATDSPRQSATLTAQFQVTRRSDAEVKQYVESVASFVYHPQSGNGSTAKQAVGDWQSVDGVRFRPKAEFLSRADETLRLGIQSEMHGADSSYTAEFDVWMTDSCADRLRSEFDTSISGCDLASTWVRESIARARDGLDSCRKERTETKRVDCTSGVQEREGHGRWLSVAFWRSGTHTLELECSFRLKASSAQFKLLNNWHALRKGYHGAVAPPSPIETLLFVASRLDTEYADYEDSKETNEKMASFCSDIAVAHVARHFTSLSSDPLFPRLTAELVRKLLHRDDLDTTSEERTIEALAPWLTAPHRKASDVAEALDGLRWAYIDLRPGSRANTLLAPHRTDAKLQRMLENALGERLQPVKRQRDELQAELTCPITYELFEDPVLATDGNTYERSAIEAWFKRAGPSSPITRAPMSNTALLPNLAVKKLCAAHRQQNRSSRKRACFDEAETAADSFVL